MAESGFPHSFDLCPKGGADILVTRRLCLLKVSECKLLSYLYNLFLQAENFLTSYRVIWRVENVDLNEIASSSTKHKPS